METIYASTISIDAYKLIVQIHSQGLRIVDIGEIIHNCTNNIKLINCVIAIGHGAVSLQWKLDTEVGYRIELATCWKEHDKIYIALCIAYQGKFTLQILEIVNQIVENTER